MKYRDFLQSRIYLVTLLPLNRACRIRFIHVYSIVYRYIQHIYIARPTAGAVPTMATGIQHYQAKVHTQTHEKM